MTYEIALYPRRPGQDWAEVVTADEVDGPPMDQQQLDAGIATFRRIEARLREQLTEPVEVWVAEETDGDVVGELTASESGLQVELYDRAASVTLPSGTHGGVHEMARRAVRVVATETGYEAYDPQTGRTYDGLFDDATGPIADDAALPVPRTQGLSTDGDPDAGTDAGTDDDTADAAPARPAVDPRMDPRMLRRRSVLYLVVGVALLVFTFLRFQDGQTDWVTWLFLGFAGFNLLAGWMMRGLAAQAVATREAEASAADAADATDEGTPGGPTPA